MMKHFFNNRSEQGVGHLLLLLGVVVIAAIAFVGYRVATDKNSSTSSKSSQATTAETAAPQAINNTKDLEQAQSAVNSSNLDSDLDSSQMDSDVNSLL
jgi:uncharacterized protein HemX